MCIVFYTLNQPGYKLILASNRDEFLDRPAARAAWHTFAPLSDAAASDTQQEDSAQGVSPWVLSGRDEGSPAGGTWLGMTSDLRIAVLTNIRIPPVPIPPNAPSRGQLLKSFLAPPPSSSTPSLHDYLASHRDNAAAYEGFNLLLFKLHPPAARADWGKTEVGYLSNRPEPTVQDIHGDTPLPHAEGSGRCRGLSNSPLSQPWPKVTKGEAKMHETLQEWTDGGEREDQLVERMMGLLQQTVPLDSLASLQNCTCLHPVPLGPNPDVPIKEGEPRRWYGTRVTTIILVREDGRVTFVERDIFVQNGGGEAVRGEDERRFGFTAHGVRSG